MKIPNSLTPSSSSAPSSEGSTRLKAAKNLFTELVNALFGTIISPGSRLSRSQKVPMNGASGTSHISGVSNSQSPKPRLGLQRAQSAVLAPTQEKSRPTLQRSNSAPALGAPLRQMLDKHDKYVKTLERVVKLLDTHAKKEDASPSLKMRLLQLKAKVSSDVSTSKRQLSNAGFVVSRSTNSLSPAVKAAFRAEVKLRL